MDGRDKPGHYEWGGHFLITPYGLRYGEVTASNLGKITLEGESE